MQIALTTKPSYSSGHHAVANGSILIEEASEPENDRWQMTNDRLAVEVGRHLEGSQTSPCRLKLQEAMSGKPLWTRCQTRGRHHEKNHGTAKRVLARGSRERLDV